MLDAELLKAIRNEVSKQLNMVLTAQTGENTVDKEDIEQLFPGMPTITDRPVMHPYGYASRARKGSLSVVVKQGDHPGNRMVIGHRDSQRPTDMEEGESVQYSEGQMQSRLEESKATLGKTSDGSKSGFAGNSFVTVSDEAGNEMVIVQHKSGAQVQIDKDGSVVLASKDGSYIYLNGATGEATVASKDGNVVGMSSTGITIADKSGKQIIALDGTDKIQITADKDVVVAAPTVTIQGGTTNLGDNAILSNTIAEALEVYITSELIAKLVPAGPPPVPPSIYNLNPALSFKASFVKQRANI